ncbi:RHS repeat-associated protein [Clostridium punense]|uniref:RHS repeat-associated protein n=1 Tax=Clostridium punense TaxID=1054297 RepID=A0ABS4K9F8_9CLOT|nr:MULTISPECIES: RHS repeat-associated core domain-containing protein [Clostridium]EQB89244.1 hypothetical protein M918_21225 [Clostridium sp. BL8]MBP2024417.1 RHS repeat-associated protein [Clostridium punense]
MNLNGTEYFYVRNAQNNIIGLIDKAGTQVVSYTYDSWGKLISIEGTLKDTVGVKNPYRYRGYRYDSETQLYYLQSRYYNPTWGRFINADAIAGSLGELLGHNIFAYTKNNPISMSDPSGYRTVRADYESLEQESVSSRWSVGSNFSRYTNGKFNTYVSDNNYRFGGIQTKATTIGVIPTSGGVELHTNQYKFGGSNFSFETQGYGGGNAALGLIAERDGDWIYSSAGGELKPLKYGSKNQINIGMIHIQLQIEYGVGAGATLGAGGMNTIDKQGVAMGVGFGLGGFWEAKGAIWWDRNR